VGGNEGQKSCEGCELLHFDDCYRDIWKRWICLVRW
jgi:hypothetical protein